MTAGPGALALIRAAYGTALLIWPGPVIQLATGRHPDRRACQVARVLGARHLAQAALTTTFPGPQLLAAGAAVDVIHAASMPVLAAVSRPGRRAALADMAIEIMFATAGLTISAQSV